ncbi:MAG: hypothetical protein Q8N09_07055 [Thermodesulfovibrionia bacterium]|nr:hypothetical protein [Thermodesulfovibrionia bacterium]
MNRDVSGLLAMTFQGFFKSLVMLDPPRQGLSSETVNKMLKITPERILYISCNPSTFARDLKKLLEKYSIESIRMIDFFPQTFHIEALAFLRPG